MSLAATFVSRPMLRAASMLAIGATAAYSMRITQVNAEAPSSATIAQQESFGYINKTFTSIVRAKELTVSNIENVNHDTKRITLDLPSKHEISGLSPASAVLVQHTPEDAWFPVVRPYTPISDPDKPGVLELLVKHYPNGKASGYLHSLKEGAKVTIRGPIPGGYDYRPSEKPSSILLIAGGAGITPIYSLAKGVLSNPDDKTKVQLVWGVNGARDIVLKGELDDLQTRHPDRLTVTYSVSKPDPSESSAHVKGGLKSGYVNEGLLSEVLKEVNRETWGDSRGTKVFLCGPPAMEEALAGKKGFGGSSSNTLHALGVDKKEVHRF